MNRQQSLKLAFAQDDSLRKKVLAQRAFEDDLDAQIEAALKRIELRTPGLDGPKWLAEEITDDAEHPVSSSTIYDMLGRRNGRRPAGEVIAEIYADEEFAAWWNTALGYEVPKKLCPLTLEQENALLRRALVEFGSIGEQKLKAIANGGAP